MVSTLLLLATNTFPKVASEYVWLTVYNMAVESSPKCDLLTLLWINLHECTWVGLFWSFVQYPCEVLLILLGWVEAILDRIDPAPPAVPATVQAPEPQLQPLEIIACEKEEGPEVQLPTLLTERFKTPETLYRSYGYSFTPPRKSREQLVEKTRQELAKIDSRQTQPLRPMQKYNLPRVHGCKLYKRRSQEQLTPVRETVEDFPQILDFVQTELTLPNESVTKFAAQFANIPRNKQSVNRNKSRGKKKSSRVASDSRAVLTNPTPTRITLNRIKSVVRSVSH